MMTPKQQPSPVYSSRILANNGCTMEKLGQKWRARRKLLIGPTIYGYKSNSLSSLVVWPLLDDRSRRSLSSCHPKNGWLVHSFPTIQPRPKSSLPAQGAIHPNHHCHCPRKSNLLPEHPDNWNLEPQKPNHNTTIWHSNITPVDKLYLQ